MKLNWFSPLPPAATDIAHFTTRLLPALAARAEVTLWTVSGARPSGRARADFVSTHSKLPDIRAFNPNRVKWAELNRADACIYNIGNNPLFHGAIWQVARQHAGIVILHDTRLHHFFDGLYRVQWRDLPAYLAAMEFYYGERGVRDGADCFRNDARNINEMAEKYPLTKHALENSLGVVVHTTDALAELSADSNSPVAYLQLPFPSSSLPGLAAGRRPPEHERPYRLVMFGYIGRNRRLEAVLNTLHGMPERDRFHLDVFGEILDDERRVKARIRELGLKRIVTLHGFATEDLLDKALARSDLAINLRYPTMGEASGSQLRIWAHALPSLVTNVGWYATLSDETVVHIRADENEVGDIQAALRAFLDNPSRFAEMGKRGRNILEEQHSPESYAQGLIEFVEDVKRHRPQAALINLAERTGAVARDIFGKVGAAGATNNAAREILALGPTDF
jgi:glycosyltransferase involved in cell wall biosynthesis